jgi:putative addiction module killer protein
MEVRHYLTGSGRDPYQEWLDDHKDIQTRIVIQRRIDRLLSGNFGDHKFCRDGIWELRIDTGPGYRVYYAKVNQMIVLLLCGGEKRSQKSDIDRAVKYWNNYQQRML